MEKTHRGQRIACIILILVLFAAGPILSPLEVNAAAVKSNVKGTISLTKGKTLTLYVKNAGKVTWKSSKPAVASVSSAGKVTARKTGTAKITAKAGKKSWICTMKVTAPRKSAGNSLALNSVGLNAADAAVFRKLYAKKSAYYEGMRWTSSRFYRWNGGIFSGGYGCSAFVFLLSDAAFGRARARAHTNFSNVRVGDILRINYNSHSVIVLKVVGNNFVVAEGNYNSKVHWGRVISRSTARAGGTYVMTRR